ncbi:MAG: recombination regulator RecX [Spirochaetales bacterium]|nr:recombination regulator RecX [Spirochaetales bacterium]
MGSGESVQIERLVRRKRGRLGEEIEVLFSDASSFFASLQIWQRKPFHEGDHLTVDEVALLRTESATIAVRARAMALLGRADHSVFHMRQKLVSRGCDSAVVDMALTDLTRNGSLDDARFAASWVRNRVRRHPEGQPALIAGLRQRGVDSATAEAAVSTVLAEDEISLDDVARMLAERFLGARGATPISVCTKMIRRGFSPAAVRRVVAELTGTDPAEIK